jgi:hypothetical protein
VALSYVLSANDVSKASASHFMELFCLFVFSFALFQKPGESIGSAMEQTAANVSQPPVASPTYKEVLSQLRIRNLSWEKKGFGSIMSATFVVHNDSPTTVKDVVVTCKHSANSGTMIDSNTRTVYEIIRRRSSASVVDMDMGFIHSAAVESRCSVTTQLADRILRCSASSDAGASCVFFRMPRSAFFGWKV